MRVEGYKLTLFVFSVLLSCQKKFEAPANIFANAPSVFIAQIDGSPFVASIYGTEIRSDSIISIAAKSDDNKTLVFTVLDSGVHRYTLDINAKVNVAGYIDVAGIAFASNSGVNSNQSGGELSITSIDAMRHLISGTFHFKGFRKTDMKQKNITLGTFNNIPYR